LRRLALAVCVAALAGPGLAAARPAPVTWCGTDATAGNRAPDLEVSSSAQVRFVYAIPSDGADNFAAAASGIATDAAWIDEWWRAQDPIRTPRFDRYPFPGCTSRFGQLDIGFVRLPHPDAYFRSPDIFQLLNSDLRNSFPDRQKTILYYDGDVSETQVCGQSGTNANAGGVFAISFVYLRSGCGLAPPGSGTSAEVAAHELIHNLGALPPGAPHACPDDAGHPCDSATDILYPYVGEASTLDVVALDYNRDDYYGHSGSWWDLQDSSWLMHLPQRSVTLQIEGSGSLLVHLDSAVIPCEAGCSGLQVDDGSLTVAGLPSSGWRVAGWSGGCTTTGPTCDLAAPGDVNATVTFARIPPVRVRVVVGGKGRVTSTPIGIACTKACAHSFAAGTRVRLTASPARGWRFAGWSGGCSGRSLCTVPELGGSIQARFVHR
jgi:Divergent InlB B-repeat domain